jgi:DNA-binding transcriptional ArsR family regulator
MEGERVMEGEPVRDTLTISRPEQLKALGHPLRLRVLEELGGEGESLTNRELAGRLGVDPGHLHFHVRMLHKAGLIELADGAGKREKPYRCAARTIRVAPELTSAGLSGDLHAAMLDEVQRGFSRWGQKGEFRGAQVTVKLPLDKARELLREFTRKLEDAEDDDAETLVFTTLFHPPASRG